MTVSFRCSDLRSIVLLLLLSVLSVPLANGQRDVWYLPQYRETVISQALEIGSAFSRDTYLSESLYDGLTVGFEYDGWSGYKPEKILGYGRTHSNIMFGELTNRLDGGSTWLLNATFHQAALWHVVDCSMCDLLIGPAGLLDLGVLYNVQNSNNPVNVDGYLAAGICVDNTFRFSVYRYPMALQATLYVPLAGMVFAPDYDQPYWYMYRYNEYGKALHFSCPLNNPAFTQQISLILPVGSERIKVGYTFDYMSNKLGGHTRQMGGNVFSIGYVRRFESKQWNR